MSEDIPWVIGLTDEEVEQLRKQKHELTQYGKEKIRQLMNRTMTETIKETLTKIKEVADEILERHKNSTVRYGGVNYADLYVEDVSYNLHLDGDETYSVLIEECSPTAYELQEYMVECLKDKLGFYVDVILEW